MIWHHTAKVNHIPQSYKIQIWKDSEWVDVFSTTDELSHVQEE
jgi:hypothetical protein